MKPWASREPSWPMSATSSSLWAWDTPGMRSENQVGVTWRGKETTMPAGTPLFWRNSTMAGARSRALPSCGQGEKGECEDRDGAAAS